MKKSLVFVAAAAAGLAWAVRKWIPQWARMTAQFLKPLSNVTKPVADVGKRTRDTASAPANALRG